VANANTTHEHWGERHKPFVPAWIPAGHPDAALPVERRGPLLDELAEAIAERQAALAHAEIPELRDLIEAVNARAPGTGDRPDLVIRGGEVASCRCDGLVFGCRLEARTRFGYGASFFRAKFVDHASFGSATFGYGAKFSEATLGHLASFEGTSFGDSARFDGATFGDRAIFFRATFGDQAKFRRATFGKQAILQNATFGKRADFFGATFGDHASFYNAEFGNLASFFTAEFGVDASFCNANLGDNAIFYEAAFGRQARFWGATFGDGARFDEATLGGRVEFWDTKFGDEASFEGVRFVGDAFFPGAKFSDGMACFSGATIQRRLRLDTASLTRGDGGLAFNGLVPLGGATIELSRDQIEERRRREAEHAWIVVLCSAASGLLVSAAAIPVALWSILARGRAPAQRLMDAHDNLVRSGGWGWAWALAHWFVRVRGGRLIWGEGSDDPEQMERAAADYELLGANFRRLPARDREEDRCRWRAHELRRVARLKRAVRDRKPWKLLWLVPAEWFLQRVCLGYLLQLHRPVAAGAALILVCAAIYYLGAGEATIAYNGRLWPGESAMDRWIEPEPLGRFLSPLWFSLTTFVTLGYGDFAPMGWFRLVTGIEALLGVALLALFTVAWGRKMVR